MISVDIVRLTFLYYINNLPKSRKFSDEVCKNNERQPMANPWIRVLDIIYAMGLMRVYVIHALVFLGFNHVTFCFHFQMVLRQNKIRLIRIK